MSTSRPNEIAARIREAEPGAVEALLALALAVASVRFGVAQRDVLNTLARSLPEFETEQDECATLRELMRTMGHDQSLTGDLIEFAERARAGGLRCVVDPKSLTRRIPSGRSAGAPKRH